MQPAVCGDDLLASLSLRQKLAQLLNVGVTGADDALAMIQAEQIGGIFVGSWTDRAMLAERQIPGVAAQSPLPLMVTIDEEGGRVSRVGELLGPDPSARLTAQTMSVDETYQMALERGQELRELGITVDFAPDVDVSSQPDDSVIGDRSYSDDPAVVIDYAGAYARGLQDAGIMPVFKHFPGHGSASGDSHTGAVTTPPLDQLVQTDLAPYRELLSPDVAVMIGHLDVPGLTDGLPASISCGGGSAAHRYRLRRTSLRRHDLHRRSVGDAGDHRQLRHHRSRRGRVGRGHRPGVVADHRPGSGSPRSPRTIGGLG